MKKIFTEQPKPERTRLFFKSPLGLRLVPFSRSNPALKQDDVKTRFLQSKIFDCGIKSAAVYAAKAKIFDCKTRGKPELAEAQTLFSHQPVKNFAKYKEKDEHIQQWALTAVCMVGWLRMAELLPWWSAAERGMATQQQPQPACIPMALKGVVSGGTDETSPLCLKELKIPIRKNQKNTYGGRWGRQAGPDDRAV